MSKRYYTDYLGDDYEIDFEPSVDAAFITPYDIASTDITNRSDALWTPAEADGTAGTDEYPRIQCIIDIALTTGLPVDLCGKRWLVREELVADLTTSDHSLTIRNGELWFQTVYGGSSTSARLVGLTITGTQPSTKDPGPHPFPTLIDLKVGLVANPFILGVELVTTHGAHLQNVTFVKFNSEGSLVLKLNSCDTTRWFGGGFAEGTKPGGTGSQGNFQHAELDSCSDTALFGLKCASGGPDPFNASYIKAGYIGTTPGIHIIDCEQTTFIGCTIEEADDEALVEASVSSGTTRDICFVNCRFEHQDVETEWVKDKNTGELVEQPQTEYAPPPPYNLIFNANVENVRFWGCIFTWGADAFYGTSSYIFNNLGTASGAGPALAFVANSFYTSANAAGAHFSQTTSSAVPQFIGGSNIAYYQAIMNINLADTYS